MELDSPAPVKPLDACSFSQHLDWNFVRNPEPEPPSLAASRSLTQRNYEIPKVYCFEHCDALGVICYTAIDDEYWTVRLLA